jgi:hyperosmotically inducible protein
MQPNHIQPRGPRAVLAAGVLALGLSAPLPLAAATAEHEKPGGDWWIHTQLLTTYTLNEHLSPFDIDVDVADGVVTLSGEVENEVEKALAEEIALGAEGVQGVDNALRVNPDAAREDASGFAASVANATLAAKVKARLLWHSGLDEADVDVDAQGDRVTLSGTAPNADQAALAARIAATTEGVQAVENAIEVRPPEPSALEKAGNKVKEAAGEAGEKARQAAEKAGQVLSDNWITGKVETSLLFDRRFSALDIGVETRDGIVHLEGVVPSSLWRDALVVEVKGIRGVKGVDASQVVVREKAGKAS